MRKLVVDDSSNVRSVTFDGDSLVVEFLSGGRYRYAGCTVDDFASACHAPSLGKWVGAALVRQTERHPVTTLGPEVSSPPTVDHLATALRVIASVDRGAVGRVARDVAGGAVPPPLPPTCPAPVAGRDAVLWIGASDWLRVEQEELTPDQADAVSHAIAVAALQARLGSST